MQITIQCVDKKSHNNNADEKNIQISMQPKARGKKVTPKKMSTSVAPMKEICPMVKTGKIVLMNYGCNKTLHTA